MSCARRLGTRAMSTIDRSPVQRDSKSRRARSSRARDTTPLARPGLASSGISTTTTTAAAAAKRPRRAAPRLHEVTDWALQLRYRVTLARVLDARRKFLDAALRYYELSQTAQEEVCSARLVLFGGAGGAAEARRHPARAVERRQSRGASAGGMTGWWARGQGSARAAGCAPRRRWSRRVVDGSDGGRGSVARSAKRPSKTA